MYMHNVRAQYDYEMKNSKRFQSVSVLLNFTSLPRYTRYAFIERTHLFFRPRFTEPFVEFGIILCMRVCVFVWMRKMVVWMRVFPFCQPPPLILTRSRCVCVCMHACVHVHFYVCVCEFIFFPSTYSFLWVQIGIVCIRSYSIKGAAAAAARHTNTNVNFSRFHMFRYIRLTHKLTERTKKKNIHDDDDDGFLTTLNQHTTHYTCMPLSNCIHFLDAAFFLSISHFRLWAFPICVLCNIACHTNILEY